METAADAATEASTKETEKKTPWEESIPASEGEIKADGDNGVYKALNFVVDTSKP